MPWRQQSQRSSMPRAAVRSSGGVGGVRRTSGTPAAAGVVSASTRGWSRGRGRRADGWVADTVDQEEQTRQAGRSEGLPLDEDSVDRLDDTRKLCPSWLARETGKWQELAWDDLLDAIVLNIPEGVEGQAAAGKVGEEAGEVQVPTTAESGLAEIAIDLVDAWNSQVYGALGTKCKVRHGEARSSTKIAGSLDIEIF